MMGVYFRCKNCGESHQSPITTDDKRTFDSLTLTDNGLQCPNTGQIAKYDKADMFWRDEERQERSR